MVLTKISTLVESLPKPLPLVVVQSFLMKRLF